MRFLVLSIAALVFNSVVVAAVKLDRPRNPYN
jgi:hypothetical protein